MPTGAEPLGQTQLECVNGLTGRKPQISRALWEHGEFTDPNLAGSMRHLQDYMEAHYNMHGLSSRPASIYGILRNPMNEPAYARVTKASER